MVHGRHGSLTTRSACRTRVRLAVASSGCAGRGRREYVVSARVWTWSSARKYRQRDEGGMGM